LGANRTGDEETVRRTVTRIWFSDLGLPDEGLDLPGDGSDLEAGRREDSVREGWCVLSVKLTREGVRFDVTRTGTVGEGEIKAPKKQGPTGLAGIKALRCLDVGQVLVVGPNHERLFCPLKPMSPFLQRQFHSQQLSVTHIIVALSRYKPAREERAGVNLLVRGRALGQDRPHPRVRRIDLHDELPGGVRLDENGGRREKSFEVREGSLRPRCPGKREGRRGETSERGCNPAVITDEPPVEICKPKKLLQFLARIGNGPVCHSTDLLRTGPHLSALYDEPKEGYRGDTELALLGLHK
jgi:hypothetical protein